MHILVGVTGCIAAYKACEVVRELQRAGHEVSVVMTAAAQKFVGLATFRALTQGRAKASLFDDADPIPHIALAEEADAFVIAPATANVCAKLAHGIADDLLTSTALACTCPVFVAPAMNVHMYENAATQANLDALRSRGVRVITPDAGYLACGDVGPGKLPEPSVIARTVLDALSSIGALAGKQVLVTSGPTVEPIDAVRFISNRSSGKMGAAIVHAALDAGAHVTVVSGPVSVAYDARAEVVWVETAAEMLSAAEDAFADADAAICAAAVADMRPERAESRKLKKGRDDAALASIPLVENPDILSALGHGKRAGQVVIGFAAETEDVLSNAQEKLIRKQADLIVANDVSEGAVFGADTDEASFVTPSGVERLGLLPKTEVAARLVEHIAEMMHLSA